MPEPRGGQYLTDQLTLFLPGGQSLPTLYYWHPKKFSPSGITEKAMFSSVLCSKLGAKHWPLLFKYILQLRNLAEIRLHLTIRVFWAVSIFYFIILSILQASLKSNLNNRSIQMMRKYETELKSLKFRFMFCKSKIIWHLRVHFRWAKIDLDITDDTSN